MLAGLERVRRVMPLVDQELPGRQQRHGCGRGVHMIDASRLEREIGHRYGNILGISSTFPGNAARKPDHGKDFVADRKVRHVIGHRVDYAGDVGAGNDRKRHLGPPLRRQHFIALAQIPVGRVDPDGMDANQHLARFYERLRSIFVDQDFGSSECMQPDCFHDRAHGKLLKISTRTAI